MPRIKVKVTHVHHVSGVTRKDPGEVLLFQLSLLLVSALDTNLQARLTGGDTMTVGGWGCSEADTMGFRWCGTAWYRGMGTSLVG